MLERKVQIAGQQIRVLQNLSLSHAGTVWDGALILIAYWNKNKEVAENLFTGKTVLELGSGTGMLGLCSLPFKPNQLYLTDLPQYVEFLRENSKMNKSDIPIHCQSLSWGNQQNMSCLPKVDTIIGSQLAYDKQNVQRLMNTLNFYLKRNPSIQIMVSFQKNKEEYKNFQFCFKNQVGVQYQLVSWEQMDSDYRDDFLGILWKKPS